MICSVKCSVWLCCCFKNILNFSVQEVGNLFTSASESLSASGFCLHLLFGSLWLSCVTLYKQKPVSTLPKCVQTGFWNKNDALRKSLPVSLGCHLGFVPYEERPCSWLEVGCWISLFCFWGPTKKDTKASLMSEKGWGMVFTKGIRIYFLICWKWEAVLDVVQKEATFKMQYFILIFTFLARNL